MEGRGNVSTRITFAISSLTACLLIYPLMHEVGHFIPAVCTDAEVNKFVWLPLFARPHVSLNRVSGEALPWVDAGGILIPTAVGTLLIAALLLLPTSVSITWRMWLFIPAVVLLLSNFGLFWEALGNANGYAHMKGLAHRLVGGGWASLAVELLPAFWSCFTIAFVIGRFYYRRNRVA